MEGSSIPISGCPRNELDARSIFDLVSNNLDAARFSSLITKLETRGSPCLCKLYDRSGYERTALDVCKPSVQNADSDRCFIEIEASDAMSLEQASRISECPAVLVTSESPNCIVSANQRFLARFGYSLPEVLGQSLNGFSGCRDKWSQAIAAAKSGRIGRQMFSAGNQRQGCDFVVCVPVIHGPLGELTRILVAFPAGTCGSLPQRSAIHSLFPFAFHAAHPKTSLGASHPAPPSTYYP